MSGVDSLTNIAHWMRLGRNVGQPMDANRDGMYVVATARDEAAAEMIVAALNNHRGAVAALRDLLGALDHASEDRGMVISRRLADAIVRAAQIVGGQ